MDPFCIAGVVCGRSRSMGKMPTGSRTLVHIHTCNEIKDKLINFSRCIR